MFHQFQTDKVAMSLSLSLFQRSHDQQTDRSQAKSPAFLWWISPHQVDNTQQECYDALVWALFISDSHCWPSGQWPLLCSPLIRLHG